MTTVLIIAGVGTTRFDGGVQVELEAVGPGEWQRWREVRLRALAEAPAAFGSRLEDWTGAPRERWTARLDLPGALDLLASREGRPVGQASGVPDPDDPHVVEVISMWVDPAARGGGVGAALLDRVVEHARALGARVVRLDVVSTNAAAVRLYERCGFTAVGGAAGPSPGPSPALAPDGSSPSETRMERAVGPTSGR